MYFLCTNENRPLELSLENPEKLVFLHGKAKESTCQVIRSKGTFQQETIVIFPNNRNEICHISWKLLTAFITFLIYRILPMAEESSRFFSTIFSPFYRFVVIHGKV